MIVRGLAVVVQPIGILLGGLRPGAFLAGAFLAGAFLAGAFLAGAFLAGAFLARAFARPVPCFSAWPQFPRPPENCRRPRANERRGRIRAVCRRENKTTPLGW